MSAQILATPNSVYCGVGNGAVKNLIYTHPTEKVCNYEPTISHTATQELIFDAGYSGNIASPEVQEIYSGTGIIDAWSNHCIALLLEVRYKCTYIKGNSTSDYITIGVGNHDIDPYGRPTDIAAEQSIRPANVGTEYNLHVTLIKEHDYFRSMYNDILEPIDKVYFANTNWNESGSATIQYNISLRACY